MKYPKPELFVPSNEEKERIAREVAKYLTADKAVKLEDAKQIQGKLPKKKNRGMSM